MLSKKVTIGDVMGKKKAGEKISCLTCYDYTMAEIVNDTEVDVLLVGDSAANVMAGADTTLPITLDQMIYHSAAVVRGAPRPFIVGDLPFGAYGTVRQCLESAFRMMKEGGVNAVKLEGGRSVRKSVRKMVRLGIPVMGHLGLMPQSVHCLGGYGVRATTDAEAERLLSDALALEVAGCFAVVLEKIPAALAQEVTLRLSIPTIGIGAGAGVDGQILVLQDMLGMNTAFNPRFLRRYEDLTKSIRGAVNHYVEDVRSLEFPSGEEAY